MADYTQPDVVSKRVRFFDGQFLEDQDFIDEQRFHLDRERRQSRLLRLTGVSEGLGLAAADEPFRVTVSAGMAVDALGRHLVLAAAAELPLGTGFANQQNVEVRLAYQESATDVGQSGDGGVGARRWEERPKVVVVAPNGTTAVAPAEAEPDLDGPTVLLGRITVADNGDIAVHGTTAELSSLSMTGGIGVGVAAGTGLDVGDFDHQDRHLTFRVAADDQHRSGIRFWAGATNQGFSVEYDGRSAAGRGLHVRTHESDADGTTRLFIGTDGHVGVGTADPRDTAGWGRVVDVVGTGSTRLSVRTANVDGRVAAHDGGVFGAPPGMVVGTATGSPLTLVTGQAARLSINAAGHVGIGTADLSGAFGWGRVVDVVGTGSTKLSVRTAKVDGWAMAHDAGMFGAPAGMIVGTGTASALTLVTNQAARLNINTAGQIGVGTVAVAGHQLAVRAEHRHLLLRREAGEVQPGRKLVFLELQQADTTPPTVSPTTLAIRFHHGGRYAYQLEVDPAGFHFRAADGEPRSIHAGQVTAQTVRIGDVVVGERELRILRKLADNELVCKLRNTYYDSYIWDSGQKRGDSPYRYALTWIPGQPVASHTKTFWQFEISDQ
ncbi:hypothetical protein [Solwaraspora sp. WMMA2065]|uniref:hypothetical protein n=1 Tax=Solwaraspora sp. WMMA2065 TaxID=3015166 RepID=UPI00259B6A4F|nr:hypothetical protein [Solwaraspora sp. WMMA2065]WJK37018.1 hypothetical protein O7610_12085 [Solwaraspora sp. WMMA2065]